MTSCSVLRGGLLYTMIVPGGGGVFAPLSRVPGGWLWTKLILALAVQDAVFHMVLSHIAVL